MGDYNITLIAAVAANGIIGNKGKLPWHCPEDLRFFKNMTRGKMIVMGMNTHKSLGKVLPGRHNIVLGNKPDNEISAGAIIMDVGNILELSKNTEIMVIGGEKTYNRFMQFANRMYITNILQDFDGDTYFPEYSGFEWVHTNSVRSTPECNLPLTFDKYERKCTHT